MSLVDQSEVRLVDQRCRLQDVPVRLTTEPGRRATSKLVMDDRDEFVPRGQVAATPGVEQARYVARRARQIVLRMLPSWTVPPRRVKESGRASGSSPEGT
jgi:hypothetical protein